MDPTATSPRPKEPGYRSWPGQALGGLSLDRVLGRSDVPAEDRFRFKPVPSQVSAAPTKCRRCEDEGIVWTGLVPTLLFGKLETLELDRDVKRPCWCDKGRAALDTWRNSLEGLCQCEYGLVSQEQSMIGQGGRPEKVVGYRPCNCEAGRKVGAVIQPSLDDVRVQLFDKMLAGSELSPRQRKMTFENYDPTLGNPSPAIVEAKRAAVAKIRRWADAGYNVKLGGKPGTGKTHLSTAYLIYCMREKGLPGISQSFVAIMNSLKDTLKDGRNGGGPSWGELAERYRTIPVLAIQDIGQSNVTDQAKEELFAILDHRLEWELPTIVTTNFTLDQLKQMGYSEGTIDRLEEYKTLTTGWPSVRPTLRDGERDENSKKE